MEISFKTWAEVLEEFQRLRYIPDKIKITTKYADARHEDGSTSREAIGYKANLHYDKKWFQLFKSKTVLEHEQERKTGEHTP